MGIRLAPALIGWTVRMKARGTLIIYSVVFAVALAALADLVGLATIVGAFAAGLVLATTERREHIEDRIKPVADLFVPIFFVSVGMKVQPGMLNPFTEHARFGLAMLLTAVAIASKLAAGLAVYQNAVRRWVVGVGMVPRGEVGLIFAGAGLSAGGGRTGCLLGPGGHGDPHNIRGSPRAEGSLPRDDGESCWAVSTTGMP